MPIVLKNSKIAGLRKSRKRSVLAISTTARRCRINTRASDRFYGSSCGPSPRSESDAPAVLRIFSHQRKRTFSTQSNRKRTAKWLECRPAKVLDDAYPINGRLEPNRVRSGYSRSDRRFQQSTIVECLHRRAKNAGRRAKGRVTTNLLQQIHPKIKTGAQIND